MRAVLATALLTLSAAARAQPDGQVTDQSWQSRTYVTAGLSNFHLSFDPSFSGANWKGGVMAPGAGIGVLLTRRRTRLSFELEISRPSAMGPQSSPGGGQVSFAEGLNEINSGVDVRALLNAGSTGIHPTSAFGVTGTVGAHVDLSPRFMLGLRTGASIRRVKGSIVREYPFVEQPGVYSMRTRTDTFASSSLPILAFGADLGIRLAPRVAIVPSVVVERLVNFIPDDVERDGVTVVRPGIGLRLFFSR
jgi:hypothetical protein